MVIRQVIHILENTVNSNRNVRLKKVRFIRKMIYGRYKKIKMSRKGWGFVLKTLPLGQVSQPKNPFITPALFL